MSCPEVVYQYYYPSLYQRASTSAVPPRTTGYPPYYDRLNVQQGYGVGVGAGAGGSGAGSVSSGGGAPSPSSPPPTRHKDDTDHRDSDGRCDDDDEDEHSGTHQVISSQCIVFTNYEGDVASAIEQHFSRTFSLQAKASFGSEKESRPMSARNFPPSFWNQGAASVAHGHGDLYSHGESVYHGATAHTPADPWHTHYQQYTAAAHHHRGLHEYHHHHQHMAGYGSLLLPPSPRLAPHAQYPKTVDWNHRLHHDQTGHHLDASSYASYSNMAGLDTPVQESSVHWF